MTTENSSRNIAIFSVIAILLLIVGAYLFYQNTQLRKDLINMEQEYSNLEEVNAQLDDEFQAAQNELESLKGDNIELNKLIDQQIQKLGEQKNQIAVLIRKNRNLDEAREEIQELRASLDQYVEEINSLKDENAFLTEQNKGLKSKSDSLATAVLSTREQNQMLLTEQEILSEQKQNLSEENTQLSKKVSEAARIRVNNINVKGFTTKESGREVRRRKAENVDKLDICFNTEVNQFAAEGEEVFYVRIINPTGETIVVESSGSGTTTLTESDTPIPYSTKQTIQYKHKEGEVCLVWSPEIPFATGLYAVEIYNKGFVVGNTTFKLR